MTSYKSVCFFFSAPRAYAEEALGCYLLNLQVIICCAWNFVKFPLTSVVIRQDAFSYVWSKRGHGCFRSVVVLLHIMNYEVTWSSSWFDPKKLGQWLLMVASTPSNFGSWLTQLTLVSPLSVGVLCAPLVPLRGRKNHTSVLACHKESNNLCCVGFMLSTVHTLRNWQFNVNPVEWLLWWSRLAWF